MLKKNLFYLIILCLVTLLLPFAVKAWAEYTIKLSDWNLVDSGKHLDWDGTSAYISQFNYAINQWESHKPGIIREDTLTTIEDVKISDKNEGDVGYAGTTYKSGKIIFNTYYMNNFNTSKKRNVAIHELGHALGLDHRDGESSSVMQSYVTSITTLCEGDRKNYDEAYKKY